MALTKAHPVESCWILSRTPHSVWKVGDTLAVMGKCLFSIHSHCSVKSIASFLPCFLFVVYAILLKWLIHSLVTRSLPVDRVFRHTDGNKLKKHWPHTHIYTERLELLHHVRIKRNLDVMRRKYRRVIRLALAGN